MICLFLMCLGLVIISNRYQKNIIISKNDLSFSYVSQLGGNIESFSSENLKCKMEKELRWRDRTDVDEKKIREINRIYSWCVDSFFCRSGDVEKLLEFLEEKCEFDGFVTAYVANPKELKMVAYRELNKHRHVFLR